MVQQHRDRQPSGQYFRIWVQGRLGEHFSDGLAGIEQEDVPAGTLLHGEMLDRSQLHSTLDLLRSLGIDVLRFEVDPPRDPGDSNGRGRVPLEDIEHRGPHEATTRPSEPGKVHDTQEDPMNVAIVFDSETGTTKAAAEAMAEVVRAAGHHCTVSSVQDTDPATVSAADAICVGSWCKGLFFIRQHATEATMGFIDGLGNIDGKPAAVFCTYKTAVGAMLRKMAASLESRGANVTGQFKSRGPVAAASFKDWVASLG